RIGIRRGTLPSVLRQGICFYFYSREPGVGISRGIKQARPRKLLRERRTKDRVHTARTGRSGFGWYIRGLSPLRARPASGEEMRIRREADPRSRRTAERSLCPSRGVQLLGGEARAKAPRGDSARWVWHRLARRR